MRLLAIEATTPTASTALSIDGQLKAHFTLRDGKTHSQTLLPLIDQTLKATDLTVAMLDGLVVSNGPGSFTGLRIALATAKALAHVNKTPIYAVSTLKSLSYHGRHFEGIVVPMLDARRGQVYATLYDHRGPSKAYTEIEGWPEDTYLVSTLIEFLQGQPVPVLFIGDGAHVHGPKLKEALGERAVLADAFEEHGIAAGLFWAHHLGFSTLYSYEDLPAQYLRTSQAERERAQGIDHAAPKCHKQASANTCGGNLCK